MDEIHKMAWNHNLSMAENRGFKVKVRKIRVPVREVEQKVRCG
jgi:hypothetical protein